MLSSSLGKLKDEHNPVIIKAKYPVGALGDECWGFSGLIS